MKRIVLTAATGLCVAGAAASLSHAGGGAAQIGFGDNFFDPEEAPAVSLRPHAPEAVWERTSGTAPHNILEDRGLFRSGPPNDIQIYKENISAGTWHYYCRSHGSVLGGMEGEVSVVPIAKPAKGRTARVQWADKEARTGTRFEVEYRAGGAWKTWEETKSRALRFGDGSPVEAQPGEEYEVRVRSLSADGSRRSGWSPALSFFVG